MISRAIIHNSDHILCTQHGPFSYHPCNVCVSFQSVPRYFHNHHPLLYHHLNLRPGPHVSHLVNLPLELRNTLGQQLDGH